MQDGWGNSDIRPMPKGTLKIPTASNFMTAPQRSQAEITKDIEKFKTTKVAPPGVFDFAIKTDKDD